jgi:hypothetical protein
VRGISLILQLLVQQPCFAGAIHSHPPAMIQRFGILDGSFDK